MKTRKRHSGRPGVIKGAIVVMILLLAAMFAMTFFQQELTVEAAGADITIASKDDKAPTYRAGETKDWTVVVTNHTSNNISQAVVEPELGELSEDWPFQTDYQHYRQVVDIPAGASVDVTFSFTQRMDVPTARYTVAFTVTVGDTQAAVQKFYVNTTEKEEEKAPETGGNVSDIGAGAEKEGLSVLSAEAGGFSNGGASYSGGSESGTGSVPRVIVTGFTTDPAEVRAGSNFTLTIHLKNTSTKTKVSNMLFDLNAPTEGSDEQTSAPAFLPASGSSSIYLNGIAAGQTADISIQLNAKADLLQKPYSIELSMKYEDSQAQQIEASSSISIPVKQEARFEFSEFELSPESIAVGEEANVMTNLYNLGRIKLYNVKAVFEGAGIEKEEVFVGNVESGNSASIDAMLEGKKATKGPAQVIMKLTYEDEAGNVSETTKELKLEVTDAEDVDDSPVMMEEEAESGFPILPLIGGGVLIVTAAAVVLVKRRNKKRMTDEEEALLDELERSTEDEQQQSEAP